MSAAGTDASAAGIPGRPQSTTAASFDRGAARYDLLARLNPGYHVELRKAASALVSGLPEVDGLRLLDLACGSGISTRALLGAASGASILGLDASEGMLAQAKRKDWPANVSFDVAVSGQLDTTSLGEGSFDGVLASYLFRNVADHQRDQALAEVYSLLRPGGQLVVHEYSVGQDPRARAVWNAVCRLVVIPMGQLVDRNAELYRYLHRSVLDFDSIERFIGRLKAIGFTSIDSRTARGWQRGILHTVVARKPEEPS